MLSQDYEIQETENAIAQIKAAAIAKWDGKWLHQLTKEYNAIYAPEEPVSLAYSARWSQFNKVFNRGQRPQGETLLRLARAAGMASIKI